QVHGQHVQVHRGAGRAGQAVDRERGLGRVRARVPRHGRSGQRVPRALRQAVPPLEDPRAATARPRHDAARLIPRAALRLPPSGAGHDTTGSFFGGRQKAARNTIVPPIPTARAMISAFLGSKGNESPNALSSDQSPRLSAASTNESTATVPTYSQPSPGLLMKKPFFQWLVTSATRTIDATPA